MTNLPHGLGLPYKDPITRKPEKEPPRKFCNLSVGRQYVSVSLDGALRGT